MRRTHEYCKLEKSGLSSIATTTCVAGMSFLGPPIICLDFNRRGLSELGSTIRPSNHVGGLASCRDIEMHQDPGGGPYQALSGVIMKEIFHIRSMRCVRQTVSTVKVIAHFERRILP